MYPLINDRAHFPYNFVKSWGNFRKIIIRAQDYQKGFLSFWSCFPNKVGSVNTNIKGMLTRKFEAFFLRKIQNEFHPYGVKFFSRISERTSKIWTEDFFSEI